MCATLAVQVLKINLKALKACSPHHEGQSQTGARDFPRGVCSIVFVDSAIRHGNGCHILRNTVYIGLEGKWVERERVHSLRVGNNSERTCARATQSRAECIFPGDFRPVSNHPPLGGAKLTGRDAYQNLPDLPRELSREAGVASKRATLHTSLHIYSGVQNRVNNENFLSLIIKYENVKINLTV